MKELEKLKLAHSETGKNTTNRWSSDLRTHKIYYLPTGACRVALICMFTRGRELEIALATHQLHTHRAPTVTS